MISRCGGWGGAITVALSNDAASAQSDSCWAKAVRGKALLAAVLEGHGGCDGHSLSSALLDMLTDSHKDVAPARYT
jgi:hypothetical protein